MSDFGDSIPPNLKLPPIAKKRSGTLTARQARLSRIAREVVLGEEAHELAFTARILVQITLPHRNPQSVFFERRNGSATLRLAATDPMIGLPYGRYPRLLLAYLGQQAVRTRSRTIFLGESLNEFTRRLGLPAITGKRGTAERLRDQMRRLFGAAVALSWSGDPEGPGAATWEARRFLLADSESLAWDPRSPDQLALWDSHVVLSEKFYEALLAHPVPLNMFALRELRSPLALDLYAWLGWRLTYLRKPTTIPWGALHRQFGADYSRTRDFKAKASHAFRQVLTWHPEVRIEAASKGLVLRPSRIRPALPGSSE